MRARHQALTALTAVAVLAGVAMPSFSGATFTSSSSSTSTVSAAADWTPPTVDLTPPSGTDPFGDEGYVLTGTVELHASAADGETGIATLAIEVRGAGDWTTVCTVAGSPATCGWDTTRGPDGPYEVRARATDGAGYTSTSNLSATTVRNQVGVQLAPLPAHVRGAVAVTATMTGNGSSTYPVEIQYRRVGSVGPWQPACVGSPCTWQTGSLSTGAYELRAQVVVQGSTIATSPVVTTVVDNTAPQVVLNDPGTPLSGTVTLAAAATDPHSGVGSVTLYAQRTAASLPTSLCTLPSTPYSCTYDTRQLPDGAYSFWAVAEDRAGNVATSSVRTDRVVANVVVQPELEGIDVQASNGGTLGKIDAGDRLLYDFNHLVAHDSVLPGWDGESIDVQVVVGTGPNNDHDALTILTTNSAEVRLGTVNLKATHMPGNGKTMTFRATMSASVVDGATGPATRVSIAVTHSDGPPQQKTVSTPTTLHWTPSGSVRSGDGRSIKVNDVIESGVADVDF